MNFIFTNRLVILSAFLFFLSCSVDFKTIQPEYKKPFLSIVSDVSKLTSFKEINVVSKKKSSSGSNPSHELIFELTNASIITYTTDDLDNLSRSIALTMKKNILNFDSFDWISVTYLTKDGSQASDSTNQYAYVYRPSDIK
jgi:hypothetical protein